MGLNDHQKTWTIRTSGTPAECLSIFTSTLMSPGFQLMGTRWKVRTGTSSDGGSRAAAVYEGRSGMIGWISMMSSRTQPEIRSALGSEMTFIATPTNTGGTICRMEMTKVSKIGIVFTADARFFKAAMRRVVRRLRRNDQGIILEKV